MQSGICQKDGDDADTSLPLEGWEMLHRSSSFPGTYLLVLLSPLNIFFFRGGSQLIRRNSSNANRHDGDEIQNIRQDFMNQLPGNYSHHCSTGSSTA